MRMGATDVIFASCVLALSGCTDMNARLSEVAGGVIGAKPRLALDTDPSAASCRLLRGQADLGTFETPARIELTPSRDDILVLCQKPGYLIASAVLHAQPAQLTASPAGWASDMKQPPRYLYPPTLWLELAAIP